MDNKHQDLHILNWKNHSTSVMRDIEIIQINFNESEIFIDFIKDSIYMQLRLVKMYHKITID